MDKKKNILIATIIILLSITIYYTYNQKSSPDSENLRLVNFNGICDNSDDGFGPEKPEIIEKTQDSGILHIKVLVAATCCVDFEGDIKYNGNTIDLKYIETGNPCDCICTTTLSYDIEGTARDDYKFTLNGQELRE